MDKIKTGDIILCSNSSRIAMGIQLTTISRWNHVGIAVWLEKEEILRLNPGNCGKQKRYDLKLYCLESNDDLNYDHWDGKWTAGVRLTDYDALCRKYETLGYRSVAHTQSPDEISRKLWKFIEEHIGYNYYNDRLKLVLSAFDYFSKDPAEGYFCSQLCALWLQKCGLLEDRPAHHYLPGDFSDDSTKIPEETFKTSDVIVYTKTTLEWRWIVVFIVLGIVGLGMSVFVRENIKRKGLHDFWVR